jgi:ribosomal 30S subunit maturation factor RimM
VKTLYADILISPVEERGMIKVYIVSDKNKTINGKLFLQNKNNKEETTLFIKGVDVSANSSKIYFERNADEFFDNSLLECSFETKDGEKYFNEIRIKQK